MNPNQVPQQPQNDSSTPVPTPPAFNPPIQNQPYPVEQPVSQPFTPPVAPPSPFAASNPVAPAPEVAPATSGYGSGTMGSQPETFTAPLADNAPKKGLNKKLLIIIIAAVVVIIAIITIILLVAKPGSSTKSVIDTAKSTIAPASQLTDYKGTAFSISYPKTLKAVDVSSSVTAGSEAVRYSTDGSKTTDGTISTVGAASTPYTSAYPRATQLKSFESSTSTKVPDSATSKDVTFTQTTYQGFESFKSTGTVLKDGATIAQATTLYIFGNNNLYLVAITVNSADTSTIGAESDAILSSFKINE